MTSHIAGTMNPIKVLNGYAGIGGNRKLWNEVANIEVTAIEIDKKIAAVYQDLYPDDIVLTIDAHEYLRLNYNNFDLIFYSPPCKTHTDIRIHNPNFIAGKTEILYYDERLPQEVELMFMLNRLGMLFGKYCIENTKQYHKRMMEAQIRARHYFWTNFGVPRFTLSINKPNHEFGILEEWVKYAGVDLSNYDLNGLDPRQIYRNMVDPQLGKHVFQAALKSLNQKQPVQQSLGVEQW